MSWVRSKIRCLIRKVARHFKFSGRGNTQPSSLHSLNSSDDESSHTHTTLVDDDVYYANGHDTQTLDADSEKVDVESDSTHLTLLRTTIGLEDLAGSCGSRLRIDDYAAMKKPNMKSPPFDTQISHNGQLLQELCRIACGMNHTFLKQQALYLLLIQIRCGTTSILVDFLASEEDDNLRQLLMNLMKCLPDCWVDTRRDDSHDAVKSVWCLDIHEPAVRYAHAATPFVDFLFHLMKSGDSVAHIALDVGFIDMLVCMCSYGFPDPRMPNADTSRWNATASLIAICVSVLEWLSNHSGVHDRMKTELHGLAERWPMTYSWALIDWQPLPEEFFKITSLHTDSLRWIKSVSNMRHGQEKDSLHKQCIKLLHLTRRTLNDIQVVNAAIRALVDYICKKRQIWESLSHEMMQTPYHIIAELFFDIVGCLLSLTNGMPLTGSSYLPFLDFVELLCHDSTVMKTVLEEAGIRSLGYDARPSWTRAIPVVSLHSRRNSLQDLDLKLDYTDGFSDTTVSQSS